MPKQIIFTGMKKIIVAIVAMLYMGVSSGIAMEIHYCMGKKAGVDFYGDQKDKCGKCGMKDKPGCCNDEHKFIKLNDSHKNVSNELTYGAPDIAVLSSYHFFCQPFVMADAGAPAVQNYPPPDYTRPGVCIMNCIFRI